MLLERISSLPIRTTKPSDKPRHAPAIAHTANPDTVFVYEQGHSSGSY